MLRGSSGWACSRTLTSTRSPPSGSCGCDAHGELALQAARETITLLKNEGGVLPLDPARVRTIAVIGPNADRSLLGGYSGVPLKRLAPCSQGIRERAKAAGVEVLHHEGCKITIGGSWQQDEVVPSDPVEDRRQIAEAVKVAARADVVVLAIGGNEQTSREAWALNHMGDRASLDLAGEQDELLDAIAATGKPIVALLFNGRPLSMRDVAEKAPAILECWYLGRSAGAPWPRRSSATTTRAASCRSRSRARWATYRPTTTTSRRRAAATSSTT